MRENGFGGDGAFFFEYGFHGGGTPGTYLFGGDFSGVCGRGVSFEAAQLSTIAASAAGFDDDMSKFGGIVAVASDESPAVDDSAADARSECEQDERIGSLADTGPKFAPGGDVSVVFEGGEFIFEISADDVSNGDVFPSLDIRLCEDESFLVVEYTGRSDTDGGDVVHGDPSLFDDDFTGLAHSFEDGVGVVSLDAGRCGVFAQEFGVIIDDTGFDIGSTKVNSQIILSGHVNLQSCERYYDDV